MTAHLAPLGRWIPPLRRLASGGDGGRSKSGSNRYGAILAGCLGLGAVSLLLPSTPTYDPWAWILWGREIVELDLNTRTGPSWKPLPVVFTTLFALAGDAAPGLWLVVARAGALLAVVMAYRLACRLAGPRLGVGAGLAAALALALSEDWVRNAALGNSEGLLVALVLLGVERHLDGRSDQAFALGFAAALIRPEVWPFLGLYAAGLWFWEPRMRRLVGGLLFLVPALWLLPELWGSGDPLRAAARAQQDLDPQSAGRAEQPAREVVRQLAGMLAIPVQAGVLVALARAVRARFRGPNDEAVAALGLVAVGWVALVALMTQSGYSGNARYLALPAALACVLGGIGLARVAQAGASVAGHLVGRSRARAVAVLTGAALLAVALVPFALGPIQALPQEALALKSEAGLNRALERAVDRSGGPNRVLACGPVATTLFEVPALAWHLRVHVAEVGVEPTRPGVIFKQRPAGSRQGEAEVPKAPVPAGPVASQPVPKRRFRPFASAGRWRVLAACGPRGDGQLTSRPPGSPPEVERGDRLGTRLR